MIKREPISTEKAPQAIGPYSQAIKVGSFVFCSGQIPLDPQTGKLAADDVEGQSHQVLKNLSAVIEKAGASLNDVVKTTIFLKDMNDFPVVNKVYGSYFKEPFPARATVQVAKLPLDVSVEIEAIVHKS